MKSDMAKRELPTTVQKPMHRFVEREIVAGESAGRL
jgi:hypothetical protein